MNSSNISNWLQILGNFGLIAGLILVAVQINQNTEIAHAQLVNESYRVEMEVPLALMGETPAESWSRSIHAPETLTDEDLIVLDAMLMKGWLDLSRLEYLVDLGYAGGVEEPAKLYAWDYLRSNFGSHWWKVRSNWLVAPADRASEVIERELLAVGRDARSAPSLAERYDQLKLSRDRVPAP